MNKKNNIKQPKNSSYWMYGLIISIFIIFTYLGNSDNFGGTKKINISTFEKYLNASEVSKITIINKTLAEVTLTDNALLNEVHKDVSKSNFLGQRNTYGPHYSFEVGDLELFQRRLEDAESKGILFNYEFKTVESKWLDVLIGFLPLIILIGLWIFFMRRMSGGGAGGGGHGDGGGTRVLRASERASGANLSLAINLYEAAGSACPRGYPWIAWLRRRRRALRRTN